jgi:hypothetical protein
MLRARLRRRFDGIGAGMRHARLDGDFVGPFGGMLVYIVVRVVSFDARRAPRFSAHFAAHR